MDATAHVQNPVTLGRAEFLAEAAPAFLVLARTPDAAEDDELTFYLAGDLDLTLGGAS